VGTLALILVPATLVAAAIALVLAFRASGAAEPRRPWWGSPAVWVVVSATSLLVGIFVAPRLLGITFLLLPFVWARGFGRRRRPGRPREE